MKIIIVLLLTVFIPILFKVSYAQNDVNRLLISGETKQLRQAARMLVAKEQHTPENIRLLAEIIEKEFESATSSRIDALSWGCRALGATGDSQYMPLLHNIYQSSTAHKKLKKYANKAYQQILASSKVITKVEDKQLAEKELNKGLNSENVAKQLEQAPTITTKGLIPKPSLTLIERQLFAIAKGEWQAIKYIAQQLNQAENAEAEKNETIKLLDVLGQFLYEMHNYQLDSEQIDVLAWICRALGESKNGRYKMLLQHIADQVTNKKLRNYAIEASNSLTSTSTPYVVGSVNFQKIINEFKQGM